ncbi:mitotic-spindle organizing protein 2-like [Sinocyclocheilus grahami]|uniref:mitotic-spindle organizing protein 2-like n=1 Tax=Sinocyclocheilus grahami TaxID=75366 RepID=UPI0007AD21D0|nr:PREDICTED: mitotic-spindle organizing protein 2-like [Sinocyclocheilus grahami]
MSVSTVYSQQYHDACVCIPLLANKAQCIQVLLGSFYLLLLHDSKWPISLCYRVIVDLLKMNVAPLAVFQTLKTMCAGQKVSETSTGDTSTASHTATAPSESREEEGVVSGKSSKTAAPPSASVSRPPRGGAKIVVYSAGDTSAPVSQVRSKTSSGQGEKSARDGSSQRVPRQVSATRGQKSAKSSGSSSSSSQLTSN